MKRLLPLLTALVLFACGSPTAPHSILGTYTLLAYHNSTLPADLGNDVSLVHASMTLDGSNQYQQTVSIIRKIPVM
jgi:hypothetical protein